MNRYTPLMIAGALLLAGCSSSNMNTVNTIKTLPIPVVVAANAPAVTTGNPALAHYHQDSRQRIDQLTVMLKDRYLQGVDKSAVLDGHSDVTNVYAALSHLEELSEMNDLYLKQHNAQGLQAINGQLSQLQQTI